MVKKERTFKLPGLKWELTFKQILSLIYIIGSIIFFVFVFYFNINTDYFSCGAKPIKTEIKVNK